MPALRTFGTDAADAILTGFDVSAGAVSFAVGATDFTSGATAAIRKSILGGAWDFRGSAFATTGAGFSLDSSFGAAGAGFALTSGLGATAATSLGFGAGATSIGFGFNFGSATTGATAECEGSTRASVRPLSLIDGSALRLIEGGTLLDMVADATSGAASWLTLIVVTTGLSAPFLNVTFATAGSLRLPAAS